LSVAQLLLDRISGSHDRGQAEVYGLKGNIKAYFTEQATKEEILKGIYSVKYLIMAFKISVAESSEIFK